jgi:Cd2+/Zn2+-exporting ATPase
MTRLAFKIKGMDCAEEVAILKKELKPLVGDVDRLNFDLLNGKLLVDQGSSPLDALAIRESVRRTGMEAIPWEEYTASTAGGGESLWERHGRAILCSVSGLLTISATAFHIRVHGLADAFGAHGDPHVVPMPTIALYGAAIVAGGLPIIPKAAYAAKRLRPDMNLLMTVAVAGAVFLGEWMEGAAVAFLFSLALLLESWSVSRARRAIASLVDLSPAMARYRCPHDGDIEEKPVEEVPVGVVVLVRPGEKIPLDGVVTHGSTTVNEAPITGESKPSPKKLGSTVFAGTLNNDGAFEFEATRSAADTTLAHIIHMIEEAQTRRAPSEQWVERFARVYTPLMMGLAIAIAVVPPVVFGAAWGYWFYQALVLLVIACPCALVISTPVSIVAGIASAAREGVLIKGGVYIEAPASLRAIAFDKTGTLTYGRPTVQAIVPLNGHTERELLERAAALESHSDHPLARAILSKAEEQGVEFEAVDAFTVIQGKGAEGLYRGREFWIGSHRLLHEKGGETEECHDAANRLEDAGHSVIALGNDDHVCGLISVSDGVRDSAADTVASIKKLGIEHVVMLTGDNEGTASAVAEEIGMDAFEPELLPKEKVDRVDAMTKEFGRVAMVGDGVNDAPAMAASSLGIAMGAAGSDVAIETADIALMSDDLSKIPWLIRHSRRTLRVIKQNIAFALGLKLVFILMALFGVATLWMAIAADMGASLLVIGNGLRLLRAK